MGQSIQCQEAVLKEVQEKYNKLTWKAEEILIENTEKDIVDEKSLSLITPTPTHLKIIWILGKLTGETSQISTKSLSNTSDTHTETFGVPVPRVFTTQTVRVCSEGRISVFLFNFAGLGSGRTVCFGAPGYIRVMLV